MKKQYLAILMLLFSFITLEAKADLQNYNNTIINNEINNYINNNSTINNNETLIYNDSNSISGGVGVAVPMTEALETAPVASLLGGYYNQLNSYNVAFNNMDMYMLMTKKQRQAIKYQNKYASTNTNLLYTPLTSSYDHKSGWIRPYASFESVRLKNGPKVSNVTWGTYFGLESELYDLGNDWDAIFNIYTGYNGSHQAFQGNDIYQNGGTIGATGIAYKGNFYTGLTANIGANVAIEDNIFGSDSFTMFMTGIASKSGYNFEFNDGKFVIQPNFMMAYSMVNTFDYTNAANIRINSNTLHAFTFAPGVKFIANLENGWQPYAGVSVIMNALNDEDFMAYDAPLEELSVKPFVNYGIGIQKTIGERFTGYLQAFVSSGGRDGIGFLSGFKWKLGNDVPTKANSTGEKKYIK